MSSKSAIQYFYQNKNIFLTGATGYLGKAILEKALRATDVTFIYLLIRPKKNQNIEQRLKDILKDSIFEKLLQRHILERIIPVLGDCTLPNLGLSAEARKEIVENVDVVVQSAAFINFRVGLAELWTTNVRSTMDLIQLAKQMPRLKAFVYVSSAYVQCMHKEFTESFNTNGFEESAEYINKIMHAKQTELLSDEKMSDELCGNFPNAYLLTKALAEREILKQASELPICIFRPVYVTPSYKEPVAGWAGNYVGVISFIHDFASGLLRVLYLHKKVNLPIVPVDYCANMILTLGWYTAKHHAEKDKKSSKPSIYNLSTHERNLITFHDFCQAVGREGSKIPLSDMLWYPFLIIVTSKFIYKLLHLVFHMMPAYLYDCYQFLCGNKSNLVRTYKRIYKHNMVLSYFLEHNWTTSMQNTMQLWQDLSAQDKQIFPFDMLTLNFSEYIPKLLLSARSALAKESPETIPAALKRLKQ